MSEQANQASITTTQNSHDLLDFLHNTLSDWQIHRCQVTHDFISQNEPMKMIYHYEQLPDDIKANIPMNGVLLKRFDELISQSDFVKLLNIDINQVKKPFQLKFYGKLVIFYQNPEVALRMHWTNTLKNFEIIDEKTLENAVKQAFYHWQLVDNVEFINKTPDVDFVIYSNANENAENTSNLPTIVWQGGHSTQFEPLPSALAIGLQKQLMQSDVVLNQWFAQILQSALDCVADKR
ncbi:hypothetical protein ACGTJS_08535 [Faucicola mancuniensis]|uniref:hypothetical protein n=1 Tax=Faucicola mancuniensis TaxID=1309795 RepID=UPI0039779850